MLKAGQVWNRDAEWNICSWREGGGAAMKVEQAQIEPILLDVSLKFC